MKSRSTNDSIFRYENFTNSSLEIFGKIPVLESIESSYIQEVCPSTSLDESSNESEIKNTDQKFFYLDVATPDTKPSDYYTIVAGVHPLISDILNEINKKFGKEKSVRKF